MDGFGIYLGDYDTLDKARRGAEGFGQTVYIDLARTRGKMVYRVWTNQTWQPDNGAFPLSELATQFERIVEPSKSSILKGE